MSEQVAYRYEAKKNPQGDVLDGAPLRDISTEEFEAMPGWLRKSVAACPFYVKVRTPKKGPGAAKTGGKE